MGIDAQRSGASELPVRAVEVRRAQGANSGPGNWQRKSTQAPSTTKAIPVWIVKEEQRRGRGRGQAGGPSGPASVAARGGIRRSGSSLRRLDDVHRHRTAPPRLAYG